MKTTLGKLRNVTSGILHTKIDDVYKFYEEYVKAEGIMTHQLPSAFKALLPILKTKLPEKWFTEEWIKEGLNEVVSVPELTEDELKTFWRSYSENAAHIWDAIEDKAIIIEHA